MIARHAVAEILYATSEFEACAAAAFNTVLHEPALAARGLDEPLRAARRDEQRHHELQWALGRELWPHPQTGPSNASFPLASRLGTTPDPAWNATITYLYEWRGLRLFRAYRARFHTLGFHRAGDLFGTIMEDERRHLALGRDVLRALPGVNRQLVHDVATVIGALERVDRLRDRAFEQALDVGIRSTRVTARAAAALIEALAL